MNCQDISRIADTGRFSALSEAERREAEAHASSCQRCAAVWAAHVRLAGLRIPPMPAALAARCRTLVALPIAPHRGARSRRLTLVGAVLVLAAAAGILMMVLQGGHAPGSLPSVVAPASDSAPASVDAAAPAPSEAPAASAPGEAVTVARGTALPLLPVPVEQDERPVEDLALQKLVQRHPELVGGPDLEDMSYFMAVMAMRPDGDVISSAVRIPAEINAYELDHELYETLPRDAGRTYFVRRKKHTPVPDGRSLRADLTARIVVVPSDYNTSRSTSRVRAILGNRYDHLLLPVAGKVSNRLTILLSGDGAILRENVELESQELTFTDLRADDPKDVARYAEGIASKLGIDVKQIGLMGTTHVEDGTIKLVANGTPGGHVEDERRELQVRYAWTRGSGETGPTLGQNGVTKPPIDLASALAIVEQRIPDAFTVRTVGAEAFMVVLTAKGEFIRAGRVQAYGTPSMMAAQLVPGVKTNSFTKARLTNKAGATADVWFVWEAPAAGEAKAAN